MTQPSVTISIAGTDITYDCAADDTILRAGLRAGIGLPYECSVGSCGTCKIELVSGEAETAWAEAPGLGERERARGRRLACQSRPLGPCTIKARPAANYLAPIAPRRRRARLVSARPLTHDMREFVFETDGDAAFVAGQYALIELGPVIGPRAFSMSNLPNKRGEWRFVIKRVPGGQGTGVLFGAGVIGATFELDGPFGLAYYRRSERDVLCIAGGSGLSPILSIVRAAAVDPLMVGRRIRVFFGGRTPLDLCAEDELKELPGFGTRITHIAAVSDPEAAAHAGWSGSAGFIHSVVEAELGDALASHEIYFAGPPVMADATQKMLVLGRKVPIAQIHFDRFY